MAPSGPRGLRGWLGAMFGHGGAAVPIIRPLVGDSSKRPTEFAAGWGPNGPKAHSDPTL